jgi:hypothetical protein
MRLAEEGTHIVKEITSYGILLAEDKSVIDKMISVLKEKLYIFTSLINYYSTSL